MCSYVSTDLVLVPQAVEEARVALLILALVVLQAEDGQRGRHGVAQVVDQELFWPAVIDAEPVRPEAHGLLCCALPILEGGNEPHGGSEE